MKKNLLCLLITFFCFTLKAQESVVLIHGFLLSHFHMVPIKRVLRCTNFDVYNFEYPSRNNTIEGHACNLVNTLQYIAQNNPGEPINFVTHSISALILRYALNLPECPYEAKIGRAVLLAPPNQGTVLGRYVQNFPGISFIFGDKSGRELLTWGPEEMSCLGQFPPTMNVLVIAGNKGTHLFFGDAPNDRFLLVEETRLDTPHEHIVMPITHGDLINRSPSLYKIRKFLISH